MGLSLPSIPGLSSIRDTVTSTVATASTGLRDFGSSAIARTSELGSAGLDLGRRAVDAAASFDVREAAATVRSSIGSATESAREGIRTGTEWAGQQTHRAADFARSHVTGDDLASRALRGAITAGETTTRFQLGVVGGVTREVVGLAGTAGQLATTAAEMQVSPQARIEYGQAIVGGVRDAAVATGHYAASVAADPGRVGSDVSAAVDAGRRLVDGQLDRYATAVREGRGPETIGMDVGTVATYLVPVGGGPVRGAVTSAVRGTGEVAARETAEVVARRAAGLADDVARAPAGTVVGPITGLSDVARASGTPATRLQEVVDLGRGNRPPPAEYLTPQRIAEHRAAFDAGASRFTLQETIDKYGLGQRDGTTFVMTRAEADAVVRASGGDLRKLEEALGLPVGQLDSGALRRVDFPPEALDELNIRMPTGNEAGANSQWLPGGFLPSGANEAVVDGAGALPGQFSIRAIE